MFDDDPVWLHLGDERFVERLSGVPRAGADAAGAVREIDYVDLRFDERVFVGAIA